jgi:hypothetical protein
MVDDVAAEQFSLPVSLVSAANHHLDNLNSFLVTITLLLSIYLSSSPVEVCNSSHQAAHYHILDI